MGTQRLLGKFGHSLSVLRARCSQPDGDSWIPNVCWRYLVRAWIGWDQSWRQNGSFGGKKRKLTQDQRLLDIFGPRSTSVGEVLSGPVSVQDIWSVLTSVEDVDDPVEVPVGIRTCDYVGFQ